MIAISISFGMIIWITDIGDFWYIYIIIGVSFVFSIVPLIIRYFRSRNEMETVSGAQPYQSYSDQSNIYQPMNQPHTSGPYAPETTKNPTFCTYCGAGLKPDVSFCENCGKAIGK